MKKIFKKMIGLSLVTMAAFALTACGSEGDDGKKEASTVDLTFQIWDMNQQAGMEDMAKAFTEKNPDIKVKVEVTPWDQYWTKLQAAATGGGMADVFWMHPGQVHNFSEGDALLDMTDKIADSEIDLSNYPEYIVNDFNIDGKQLAVPKDYSTLALWYNKDLFDAKGVTYPDDTWTWDTWMEAAEKLTDKDAGIYGMLAPADGQNFWYNLLWQNGSDVVSQDGKKVMLNDPKSVEAVEFGVSFIEKGFSPTTKDFANTTENQYFESGKAAMITAGSWMAGEYLSIDGLNIGVAPLPKNVAQGSAASGMGYAIAANSKYVDEAWKFVEFLGSKEANIIQAESGAAIPAYTDTQGPWVETFPDIDAQVFVDAAEYGHAPKDDLVRAEWITIEQEYMLDIFSLKRPVKEGLAEMSEKIQKVIDDAQ